MRKFLILMLLFTLLCSSYAAAEKAGKDSLQIKHAIYFSQQEILVRERNPGSDYYATPYSNYEYREFEYRIGCAAEFVNNTDKPVKNAVAVCTFKDKWGKVLASRKERISLKPGDKTRRIFDSGLYAQNMAGNTTMSFTSAISNSLVMSPLRERDFLHFNENVDFDKYHQVTAQVNLTMTDVSCEITMEQ